jgi:hypothetical protein
MGLAGVGITSTGAFSNVDSSRETKIQAANDPDALIGLTIYSPVHKNTRESLVDVENNTGSDLTVTVSLDATSDGTLFDLQGDSGDPVQFPLGVGQTKTVEIESRVESGTIPFTVTGSGHGIEVEASRETTGAPPAIRINKVQNFGARSGPDDWRIEEVQVQDQDGDDDLDRVEYEIADSSGTVRATRTDTVSNGGQYQQQGLSFTPDNGGYDIPNGEAYTLTVTAYDADGNAATVTRTTTASGGGNKNIRIKKIQNFRANAGPDEWSIKQVQVQDQAGAENLDRVEYEIVDSGGTIRATRTDGASGQQYQVQNITIIPNDSSYSLSPGETYTLTIRAYDADGNFGITSVDATA